MSDKRVPITCERCGGLGTIQAFYYIEGGRCFDCGGSGNLGYTTEEEIRKEAERKEKRRKAREKKRAEKQKKIEAQVKEVLKDKELKKALAVDHYIINDISYRLNRYGTISKKQITLVKKIVKEKIKRDKEEKKRLAKLTDIDAGKYEIEGVILSVKSYENNFNGRVRSTLKMLVQLDNGNRVFGTFPSSLYSNDPAKDRRVSFTATFSQKEKGFGYFKRPTKAKFVD